MSQCFTSDWLLVSKMYALSGRTAPELNLAGAAPSTSAAGGTPPIKAGLGKEGAACATASSKLEVEADLARSTTGAADANASTKSEVDLAANAAAMSPTSATLEGKVDRHLVLGSCYARVVLSCPASRVQHRAAVRIGVAL